MIPGYDDDTLELLQDSVAELVARVVQPQARAWDEQRCISPSAVAAVGGLGLLGLGAPVVRDGMEGDPAVVAMVLEALAQGDASLALAVAVHTLAVVGCGERTEARDLVDRWLTWVPAVAVCRTDLRSGEWVLQGPEVALVLAGQAQRVVLEAWEDEARAVFVVPMQALESALGPSCSLGMRAASIRALRLDGLRLPRDARVETSPAPSTLVRARLFLAAIALGLGRVALADALAHANRRIQFGRPIVTLQATQLKLATMATGLEAAAALTRSATKHADRRGGSRAMAARLFAAREAVRVCSDSLQIHGGYGYTCDLPVERRLRDARWCVQAWWSPAAERVAIAESLRARA